MKAAIVNIAKTHPQIGIGKIMVPSFLMLVKEKITQLVVSHNVNYLSWNEYEKMCKHISIHKKYNFLIKFNFDELKFMLEQIPLVPWTRILQNLGVLVWNNSPALKDVNTPISFQIYKIIFIN